MESSIANYKGFVYKSGNGLHAEDKNDKGCGPTDKFYMTGSPCPNCTVELKENHMINQPSMSSLHWRRKKYNLGRGRKNVNKVYLAITCDGYCHGTDVHDLID